ncbi:MAG: hypothetical protein ACQESF_06875 [Nanobdellota archaeon]
MNKSLIKSVAIVIMLVFQILPLVSAIDTQNEGHRVDSGTNEVIPYYADGYKVYNQGSKNIFVGTKTWAEFNSFVSAYSSSYYKSDCRATVGCDGIDPIINYGTYSSGTYGSSVEDCATLHCSQSDIWVTTCYYRSDCRTTFSCDVADRMETYSFYSSGSYGSSVKDCATIHCCP